MQTALASVSNELAKLVEQFQPYVVSVHARAHYSSSGVLWKPGVVVTADHTIRHDEEIQVTLPSGQRVDAALAGRDPGTDIAVLKVEGAGSVTAPTGAEIAAKAGELALVIGRSPHSGPNASLGIISALSGPWRTWRGGQLENYIRLDATLFPHSSGGAVVDCRGQLLGIATSGLSRIAGLVIPASAVNRVLDVLLAKGHVPRGYLGIGAQPVAIPSALRNALALAAETGIMIVNVESGGPADRAGLLLGDVIVSLGEATTAEIDDLQAFFDAGVIGKSVKARVIRAGALHETELTIGERPGK